MNVLKRAALAATVICGFSGTAMADVEYFPLKNPMGPFSDAVRVDNLLILSGKIGNPTLPTMDAQSKDVMDQVAASLKERGLSMDDVVKCTVMLADMSKWGDFNKVYTTYFKPGRLPARSAFGTNGLAMNAQVELECWAYMPKK